MVHNLFFSVAIIKTDSPISNATGFFYLHNNGVFYLITNRHCIVDEAADFLPRSIELLLHTDASDITVVEPLNIPLYNDSGDRLWLEHPKGGEVDVVAIAMPRGINSRYIIRAAQSENFLPRNVDMVPGEDLMVIGFPLGFYDQKHFLPLVRNASLASAYRIAFDGNPYFLADARMHNGASGSPVWTKPRDQLCTTDGSMYSGTNGPGGFFFLAGIFSAIMDLTDCDGDDPKIEPFGLNVVWYAELIPEIISQAK